MGTYFTRRTQISELNLRKIRRRREEGKS